MSSENPFDNMTVISTVTRQDLIDMGDMVIVPDALRKEAGFKFEIGVTNNLWESAIALRGNDEENGQSIDGRIWDMLTMAKYAIRRQSDSTNRAYAEMIVQRFEGGKSVMRTIEFIAHIGPGDDGAPVFTFMLPIDD